MGNCQAIDNATLLIQHPNGRVDKLYWPVPANEIMKMNPGHYVALLLTTTTLCPPTNPSTATATATTTANRNNSVGKNTGNIPVRITRIKLLKPTDTLVLGHVYRLITTQEVMKGLWAKKYAKKQQQQLDSGEKQDKSTHEKFSTSQSKNGQRRSEMDNSKQVKQEKHRSSTGAKPRTWHPKLHSISEATS
ncbi:PREDICTED: uncharacterized protein LOC109223731 [Nicotiana attenuata]|uniref:Uncharacterized protein n=1 Tax=Nicotiana attenuata TaxID=49451 RepID=A0A1J6IJK7_NICAT|nr:PREDICTED: uncharacterized protein LOC109223731 [Nicotiana attenuata]OIT04914.1 hypothetical protein A4A49_01254 [Nicotiana attenuata]